MNEITAEQDKIDKIVLAYSGGLDTSFCIPYLIKKYDSEVITATVNTGGSDESLDELEDKAIELGADAHHTIDAKEELYEEFISYLIKGNVLKGDTYPLCVGAERVIQAEKIYELAVKENADAIAHGCTPAGNDQVRFDVYFNAQDQNMEVLAPVRDLEMSREEETEYLNSKGLKVKDDTTKYSINTGLWGTTIGGGETHNSWSEIPGEAYTKTKPIDETPDKPVTLNIHFEEGFPTALNGKEMDGLSIIKELNEIGEKHGVGRGIHLGETILGIKGRIAFEAPAPLILIEGHKALEKLVLSKEQQKLGASIGDKFGEMLHEAQYYDLVIQNMKDFMDSQQRRVTGNVKIKLFKGNISPMGCKSDHSLIDNDVAKYGEEMSYWDGKEAAGFCKLYGLSSLLFKEKEV